MSTGQTHVHPTYACTLNASHCCLMGVQQVSVTLQDSSFFAGASDSCIQPLKGLECALSSALAAVCVSVNLDSPQNLSDLSIHGFESMCANLQNMYLFMQILLTLCKSIISGTGLPRHICTYNSVGILCIFKKKSF